MLLHLLQLLHLLLLKLHLLLLLLLHGTLLEQECHVVHPCGGAAAPLATIAHNRGRHARQSGPGVKRRHHPRLLSHVMVEVHELLVAIKVVGVMVMVVLVEVGKVVVVVGQGLRGQIRGRQGPRGKAGRLVLGKLLGLLDLHRKLVLQVLHLGHHWGWGLRLRRGGPLGHQPRE